MNQSHSQIGSALIVGCGYLGLRAAKRWLEDESTVFAVTRSPETAADFHDAGIVPIQLDLASPPDSIDLPVVDVVLWAVGYDRTAGAPREVVWLEGLNWLLQNLKPSLRRFLYVSSTSVYGNVEQERVTEDSPALPVTEGGRCCRDAEQMVLNHFASQSGSEARSAAATVLRMAGIYGPDRLLRRITDLKQQTPIVGDAEHWLNLIHVDDAVSAVHFLAGQPTSPPIINVANAGTIHRRDYYQQLAALVNAPNPVFGSESATGRARSGNKRVTSRYDLNRKAGFRFEEVADGLNNAFELSSVNIT